jgi:hypothetical protein
MVVTPFFSKKPTPESDGEGQRVFVKVDDGAARIAAEAQDRALSRCWG